MAVRFPLAIVISAVDAASPMLRKVESNVGRFFQSTQALGKGLSMTVTPAVAALGAFTFKTGAAFEQSMLRIKAAAGASAADIAMLRKESKKLVDLGVGADDAGRGMVAFARAGLTATQTQQILRPSILLSTAAMADAGQTADDLVNIMVGAKIPFTDASTTVDTLTWATDQTTNNLDDLTQALRLGGATSAAMGESFEDTVGILALMGQAGFKATLGGTALRGFLNDLSRISMSGGSAAQQDILKRHGLSPASFRDTQGNTLKMRDALKVLEDAALNGGEMMQLFGERAGPGLLGLLNQGTGKLDELIRQFGEEGIGSASRKAAVMMSGPEGALRKLTAEFQNLQVAIGESGFIQFAADGIRVVTGWVKALSEASPMTLQFGTTLFVVAAAMGPVIYTFGTAGAILTKVIGALVYSEFIPWLYKIGVTLWTTVIPATWAWTVALLANPVTWIVVGVMALVGAVIALVYWWDEVVYALKWVWNTWISIWQGIYKFMFALFPKLEEIMPDWLKGILVGDTLKFDLKGSVDKSDVIDQTAAAGGAQESRVRVDFNNMPRGTKVTTEQASGGFQLNTGYAMAGA